MAAANSAVKSQVPDKLMSHETADSLEHWIHKFKVYIQRDPILSPYLTLTWNYNQDNMGFVDPQGDLPEGQLSAAMKAEHCKLFLAHVASFMEKSYYTRKIERRTTSANSIWKLLRELYNVEISADTLLDIGNISYDKSESYLSFFHKLLYHAESNLAPANMTVDHVTTGADGDSLTVTMMDLVALQWLSKVDMKLIDRVKVDFAVRIKQGERLSAMVPDIAKALPGILKQMDGPRRDMVNSIREDIEEFDIDGRHTELYRNGNRDRKPFTKKPFRPAQNNGQRKKHTCHHCLWLRDTLGIKEVDPYHSSNSCSREIKPAVRNIIETGLNTIPQSDEESESPDTGQSRKEKVAKLMPSLQGSSSSKGFRLPHQRAQDDKEEEHHKENINLQLLPDQKAKDLNAEILHLKARILHLKERTGSPKMHVTLQGVKTVMLIDEGSEMECMDAAFSKKIGVRQKPSNRSATAAGNTDLTILGESEDEIIVDTKFQSTHIPLNLGRVTIVDNLGVDLILGEGGKARNNISTNPNKRSIILEKAGKFFTKPYLETDTSPRVCKLSEGPTTVYANQLLEVNLPHGFENKNLAVIPRGRYAEFFQPKFFSAGEKVQILNSSDSPITIKNSEHIADMRHVTEKEVNCGKSNVFKVHGHEIDQFKFVPTATKPSPPDLESIQVDPDNTMTSDTKRKFEETNKRYRDLFTTTPGRYSGYYGDSDTSIKFTSKPVQNKKVYMPTYNTDMNNILGDKMNELMDQGILLPAEQVGVSIEYISPSLLVPKPGEENSWRLVTDFTGLNRYIQRDASTSPTIQEARTTLSRKRYFCEMDLSNYFFQGGLRREDCAFLGVMHPTRGPLVYTASPQGLKNSSEASYNRLGLIYGDMVREEKMTRMADGIFPLGNSHEELLRNYIEVLDRAEKAGLTFKPSKTKISPRKSVIFGWSLQDGRWSPQPHVISSLTRAERPKTVKQMRSFTGAVKQLSDTMRDYANLLHPLEKIVGSRGSNERLVWTEDLEEAFNKVKEAVAKPEGVHVPRREDQLVTSSDFSKHHQSVGGMLTIVRKEGDKEIRLLGGHYSARIDGLRKNWYPCDGEAFAMKMVLEHFAHYIRDSKVDTLHLTDSLPVVMAHRRAMSGRFSSSPKIATLLTTLSSLPVRVEHRPGSHMVVSDHASRHPPDKCKALCDICKFNSEEADLVDNSAIFKINDDGAADTFFEVPENVPFLQLRTWRTEQKNDSVHSKLVTLMHNGQEPERRKTGGMFTTLKHLHGLYMKNNLKLHKSGVVMVRSKSGHFDGFSISVPEALFKGLCYMFHARLGHPKKSQLEKFMGRYFYVPGMPAVIDQITTSCLQCLATAKLPKPLLQQSTTIPSGPGTSFSADVLERKNQSIFVCKDSFTQHVSSCIAEDQTVPQMRQAIITSTSPFISMAGATLKLDSAPSFQSIASNQSRDPELKLLKLKIETSRPLNKNGNPEAEATIAELKKEILNIVGKDDPLTPSTLSIATRMLNQRIRANGKSAMEMMTSRDMMTGEQFEMAKEQVREEIADRRDLQHKHDMNCKGKTRKRIEFQKYNPGDLVMLREMGDLSKKREVYIVVKDEGNLVEIRKMEKQLRLKTYEVDRDQIFKIFKPLTENSKGQEISEEAVNINNEEKKEEKVSGERNRMKRRAAEKSEIKTHQLAIDKVIRIARKEKKRMTEKKKRKDEVSETKKEIKEVSERKEKEEKEFITIHFYQPQRRQRVRQRRNLDNIQEEVNQEPGHDIIPQVELPGNEADHDEAFLDSTVRSQDKSSSDLSWDHAEVLVNLVDPLINNRLFSDDSNDEVFREQPQGGQQVQELTPDLTEVILNTPQRRVTRSLLRSGTVPLFSETSNDDYTFDRNSQLRRPLKVVVEQNADSIADRLAVRSAVTPTTRPLTKSAPPSPHN